MRIALTVLLVIGLALLAFEVLAIPLQAGP